MSYISYNSLFSSPDSNANALKEDFVHDLRVAFHERHEAERAFSDKIHSPVFNSEEAEILYVFACEFWNKVSSIASRAISKEDAHDFLDTLHKVDEIVSAKIHGDLYVQHELEDDAERHFNSVITQLLKKYGSLFIEILRIEMQKKLDKKETGITPIKIPQAPIDIVLSVIKSYVNEYEVSIGEIVNRYRFEFISAFFGRVFEYYSTFVDYYNVTLCNDGKDPVAI